MKYEVTIKKTETYTFIIEDDDADAAIEKARDMTVDAFPDDIDDESDAVELD